MSRRRDLFARISLDYADHPKIAALSDAAFRAHVEMILYSRRYMTDGQIAKQIAKRWPEQALSELLANDPDTPSLALDENGNYHIHGFSEMQETRDEIEHKRRIRAEAGRKGGRARAKQAAKQTSSKLLSKTQAETETETETEVLRAKRLPTSWAPTQSHIDRAQKSGLDLERELIKFRAWADEKGATSKSWNQRFTRWLINAEEYANRNRPAGAPAPNAYDPWAAGYAQLDRKAQEGGT